MKIEEIDITEIKPYKNNPREIPVEAVEKVMQSINFPINHFSLFIFKTPMNAS